MKQEKDISIYFSYHRKTICVDPIETAESFLNLH